MIGVLILSHGNLSKGLVHSAKMVGGVYHGAARLSLTPGTDPEEFTETVKSQIRKLDKGYGVLILTDIRGGTPFFSACRSLADCNSAIVTGANLGMVTEALLSNDDYDDLREFAQVVCEAGKATISTIFEVNGGNNSD